MIRIAVCDDETGARDELNKYCRKILNDECEIVLFSSGEELIENLKTKRYDLLFLDIEMPEMNGITIKEYVESKDGQTFIIFVTNYMQFMNQAFGRNVIGYIQKPVDINLLRKKMERVKELLYFFREIEVKDIIGNYRKVICNQITYICSDGNYTKIIMNSQNEIMIKKTIKDWMDILDNDIFVRVHRSYIVNMEYIIKIEKKAYLLSGKEIPIKRGTIKLIKDKLNNYIRKTTVVL